jgi:hypothetical protein
VVHDKTAEYFISIDWHELPLHSELLQGVEGKRAAAERIDVKIA